MWKFHFVRQTISENIEKVWLEL